MSNQKFQLISNNRPAGDQPKAIRQLLDGLGRGYEHQTLMGVTGSGKTFTIANVIEKLQKPALVIAHNKTLAAQLTNEFRELFPHNSVNYFVSYYDYYQPEAYLPSSDTYIDKEALINDEIDKLRHAATMALLTRRDVIVVASVSCIYGLGAPEVYAENIFHFKAGDSIDRKGFARKLVELQFTRTNADLKRGTFRLRGDNWEIMPPDREVIYNLELKGGKIEKIYEINPVEGFRPGLTPTLREIYIAPAKHFITPHEERERAIKAIREELKERLKFLEKHGKLLEAERLERRTKFDIAMMREIGYCHGIENYSRHLSGRSPGEPPDTLLDYFPHEHGLSRIKHGLAQTRNELARTGWSINADDIRVNPPASTRCQGEAGRSNSPRFGSRLVSPLRSRESEASESERAGEAGLRESADDISVNQRRNQRQSASSKNADFLTIIDESHMTVPQLHGMYEGDRSRKETLIEYGFRLPSAIDNRPLKFEEFQKKIGQVIYTSATPGPYELEKCNKRGLTRTGPRTRTSSVRGRRGLTQTCLVEQVIRPTGLVDPKITVRPARGQIDDLIPRIEERVAKKERVLITTLTKKMAEDLASFLETREIRGGERSRTTRERYTLRQAQGANKQLLKVAYLHSDVKTLERIRILTNLRKGKFDVLVGVNLLREGLDLPEVSLVAILDADKEGFLRSETSLIQTIGRAARNVAGEVLIYADQITGSVKRAVQETERRRKLQIEYNKRHGITPKTIEKKISDILPDVDEMLNLELKPVPKSRSALEKLIVEKEREMKESAKRLDFELATLLRDEVKVLKAQAKKRK